MFYHFNDTLRQLLSNVTVTSEVKYCGKVTTAESVLI